MNIAKNIAVAAIGLCALAASCRAKPILVGVPIVQTGIRSGIGISARNGMELALREINAGGGIKGRPLELLVRDDKDDPDLAAELDAELIDAGAVALVGHMASVAATKAVAVADARRVPILSPTISSTDYSGKDDYFLRIIGTSADMGRALGGWASAAGYRAVGVLLEISNESYTRPLLAGFAEAIGAGGGRIVTTADFRSSSATDYEALLDGMLAAGALDSIFGLGSAFDVASICQALAKERRRGRIGEIQVLAPMWALTEELCLFGGKTVEGAVLVGDFDAGSTTPAYLAFQAAYRAAYAAEPDFAAVYGYDALQVAARALRECDRITGEALREAILRIGGFEGLQGPIPIDRYGDARRESTIFKVLDGRFAVVK